jgi:dynein heavy chain
MIDITEFQAQKNSLDLSIFLNSCMKNIEFAKDTLAKKWFVEVQNIFYQGNKRKLVPSTSEPQRQKSFYDCAAAIMTSNLQSLCINSLDDYKHLLTLVPKSTRTYEHSGFVLRLILADTEIKYEPSFKDFEISLLNMVEIIMRACSNIPRVETKLYSDSALQQQQQQQPSLRRGEQNTGGLVPVILEHITQKHKADIVAVLQRESQGPIKYAKTYDKYTSLINRKADEEIEAFLKEEHTFNEYERQVRAYQRLVKEISYNTAKVERVGMFELHCDEMIRTLAKRAENLLHKLLDRMLTEHFDTNKL